MRFQYILLITAFLLSSCTFLQWRASDEEIYGQFIRLNIPTQINYYPVDSLNLNIRFQHVNESKSNINLIFLHGSPSSLSAWNGYLTDSMLVKKANMYAIDRPGYGYSNFGEEMPSIGQQAELMSAIIDHYHLKNVIVIGSSYGGPIAARMAVLNKNIRSVMMISPAIDPNQEKKVWGARFTQWWLTRWLVPTSYRVAGDEKTVHAEELKLFEADWKLLEQPIIHIHGNEDDLVPYGNVDYTVKRFKNIKIITTPNTGHEIAWGRPELIKPHIMELISKVKDQN